MNIIERGWLPDPLLRMGIRQVCAMRLRELRRGGQAGLARKSTFLQAMNFAPIALHSDAANVQHYEVPAEFYKLVLGANLKYSSAWWDDGTTLLDEAESRMLDLTMNRADLADGQQILELGCGWGSLTLAMARRFPAARIVAVSNSHSQRQYIEARLQDAGLDNVDVLTRDMNQLDLSKRFDRVVSVEMFEHMRNYRALLKKIGAWLKPDGKIFVHIFCHRDHAYPYDIRDASDWLAKYFFTGGMMPSYDIFEHFTDVVTVESTWRVDGRHYALTAEAWLRNLDERREAVLQLFTNVYGNTQEAVKWLNYWRVFFLACAELFAFRGGREWFVGHYLMSPVRAAAEVSESQAA